MIFSCLLRRLFLLLLVAAFSVSPGNANAQCPGGKPPNRDGSCGRPQEPKQPQPDNSAGAEKPPPKRSRNKRVVKTCSINVLVIKKGGGSAPNVNLALDDPSRSAGVTDAAGAYKFTQLPCGRKYKVTPAHPEFAFNLASVTITNLKKNGSAVFIAAARGNVASKTSKTSKRGSRPCNPAPKTLPRIKFDDPVTGKLSPQISWCDESVKGYFHSYQLDGAIGGDIIQFDLQSDGAPGQSSYLLVQVIGQNGNEIAPDGESDASSNRQVILPTAGNYTLRVVGDSDKSSDYRLSVTRKGLTEEGYRGQLELAYAAIAMPDMPTFYSSLNQRLERLRSSPLADGSASERKALEQKINEAAAVLERLRNLVPDKSDAYSMLAAIYLYHRKDLTLSHELATKSLALGGEARFRVVFGQRLDRDQRRLTDGNFPCWLIIKKGKISCESFRRNEGDVFTSKPEWIEKKSLDIPLYRFGLMIYGEAKQGNGNEKREYDLFEIASYYFVPLSSLDINVLFPLTEVSTIKNFIKQFVENPKQKKKD